MLFEPGGPACTRGAPSTTHPLPHFLKGALSPAENAAAEKGDPPGRMGAYAFSSMADHTNPLEGDTLSRTLLYPMYDMLLYTSPYVLVDTSRGKSFLKSKYLEAILKRRFHSSLRNSK